MLIFHKQIILNWGVPMETGLKLTARDKMETAYFEFLEHENYSKITVSDIITRAGVSRTTFYRHYVDIFDMHEKVAQRFSEKLIEECLKKVFISTENNGYFDEIVNIFKSQDKYIMLISGKNGSRFFFEALYKQATTVLPSLVPGISERMQFRLKFITIASIGVYVKNILENREHQPEFIDICKKIVDIEGIIGGKYADEC